MTAKVDITKLSSSELAELITQANTLQEQKAKQELEEKLQQVKDLITKLGLEVSQVAETLLGVVGKKAKGAVKSSSPIIFKYEKDGVSWVKAGLKGATKWAAELKGKLSHQEALKHAIGEDGKTFVNRVYKEEIESNKLKAGVDTSKLKAGKTSGGGL